LKVSIPLALEVIKQQMQVLLQILFAFFIWEQANLVEFYAILSFD